MFAEIQSSGPGVDKKSVMFYHCLYSFSSVQRKEAGHIEYTGACTLYITGL